MSAADARVAALADRPVFVVGSPRSGTSWVQRLLVSHPDICGGQESHFFSAFSRVLDTANSVADGHRHVGLRCYWTREALYQEIRRIWRLTMQPVIAAFPQATVLLEKTPDHALEMERILRLLPDARFIHVVRDSRGAVASMLSARKHEWGRWAPSAAKGATILWSRNVTRARAAGAPLGPQRYVEVFYEDLLGDTPAQLLRLLKFIGVSATHDQAAQIAQANSFEEQRKSGGTPLFTPASDQTAHREPPGFFNTGKADSWKRTLSFFQKVVVWRYSWRAMRACGYDWSGRRTPQVAPARSEG